MPLSPADRAACSLYLIYFAPVRSLPQAKPKTRIHPITRLEEQLQATAVLADLAHLTDRAHRALVLGVVLGPVKRALLICGAAVDGRVAGGTDLELGELVELDLYVVMRVALSQSLCLLGL